MQMFGDAHSQLILYVLNHYTAKMTAPMYAYSHTNCLYKNHMHAYKSVYGYTARRQVLYIATVGAHMYLAIKLQFSGRVQYES